MSLDGLGNLIEGAYEAALDESLWAAWVCLLRDQLGFFNAVFGVVNAADGALRAFLTLGPSEVLEEDYHRHWGRFDPQNAYVRDLQGSCVYEDADHVNVNDKMTVAYQRWQMAKGGFEHHLSGASLLGDGGLRGVVALHARNGHGPATEAQRSAYRAIFPHMNRALKLGFQHAALLSEQFWNSIVEVGGGDAALLLDDRCRVIRSTSSALTIASARDGLRIIGDRLRCDNAGCDARLAAVLAAATRSVGAQGGAVSIPRRTGRRPYILIAYPLVGRRRALAPSHAAAVVRIIDHSATLPAGSPILKQAFGLTTRQAELAQLLLANHSLESAAATLGVAVPTARVHLHHLFRKTRTSRQSELVRALITVR